MWRYNPALEEEGKNPFQLDSKEPNWEDFQGFLKGEVRYASVMKQYPAEAEELFKAALMFQISIAALKVSIKPTIQIINPIISFLFIS